MADGNAWLGAGKGRSNFNNGKGIYLKSMKRYFMLDAFNWKLHCFSLESKTNCSGFPIKLNGSAALSYNDLNSEPNSKADMIQLGETTFYVKTDRFLYCFDAISMTPCSSGWPIAANTSMFAGRVGANLMFSTSAFHYENPIGSVQGVCNYVGCFDFKGRLRDDWGASAYMRSKFTWPVVNHFYRAISRYETTMGRSFLFGGLMADGVRTPVFCWDHIANQSCPGFAWSSPDDKLYTLQTDPTNPTCVYYTTDGGYMGTFDIYSGSPGCRVVALPESTFTDKYDTSCSGKPSIVERRSLRALNVTGGTVSGLKLTVTTSTGQPIANWTGIDLIPGAPLDLTSLTMDITGMAAQYLITFVAPVNGTPNVALELVYRGPGPELCMSVILNANQSSAIPVLAQTINKESNPVITSFNRTIDTHVCLPPNVTGVVWVDTDNDTVRDSGELPFKNKPVKLQLPDGTWLYDTTDAQGNFAFSMPNVFANRTFAVLDAGTGFVLMNFTTSPQGSAFVPIPIPIPAEQPGETSVIGGNDLSGLMEVCATTPYHVVLGSLSQPNTSTNMMQVDFTAGTNFIAGSFRQPRGWSVQFSTDGGITWAASEPSPASSITNIRTQGLSSLGEDWVNATGNTAQFFSSASFASLDSKSVSSGSSGGDAYDTLFANEQDRLYFVYHHAFAVQLDCRIKSTGQPCPKYDPNVPVTNTAAAARSKFIGYSTSMFASGHFKEGNLFLPVVENTDASGNPNPNANLPIWGRTGILCINVSTSPPSLCSTPFVRLGNNLIYYYAATTPTGYGIGSYTPSHSFWMKSTDRYYVLEAQKQWNLYCFEWKTMSKCPSDPVINGSAARTYDLYGEPQNRGFVMGIDSERIFAKSDTNVYCYFSRNHSACPGWPLTLGQGETRNISSASLLSTWTPSLHQTEIGINDGVCLFFGCFDLAGNLRTDWPPKYSLWALSRVDDYVNFRYTAVTTMGRLYGYQPGWASAVRVFCFDFSANSNCAGFSFTFPTAYAYTLRVDPSNPYCIFYATDPGAIGSFDALTGKAGCPSLGRSELALTEKPQSTCSGKSTIVGRDSLTIARIVNGTASSFLLSVLTANGDLIPGFIGLPMTLGQPLSLANLTMDLTGPDPRYSLVFVNATGNPTVQMVLRYFGPGFVALH